MKASINAAGVTVEIVAETHDDITVDALTNMAAAYWQSTYDAIPKPAEAPRQQLGYAAQTEATTPRRARFEWSMGDGRQPGVDA